VEDAGGVVAEAGRLGSWVIASREDPCFFDQVGEQLFVLVGGEAEFGVVDDTGAERLGVSDVV